MTLKVRHADFRTVTRARSFAAPVPDKAAFLTAGEAMLAAMMPIPGGARLLGLTLSGIVVEDAPAEQPRLPLS